MVQQIVRAAYLRAEVKPAFFFDSCRFFVVSDLFFVGGLVWRFAEQDAVLVKGGVRGHEFFLLVGAHCCNRVKVQR